MQNSQIVRVELKYCECCGGLLLRPAGSGAIYCAVCAARVRELAPARAPKRRGRPPASTRPTVEATSTGCGAVKEIQAVAACPSVSYGTLAEASEHAHGAAGLPEYARRPVQPAGPAHQQTRRMA